MPRILPSSGVICLAALVVGCGYGSPSAPIFEGAPGYGLVDSLDVCSVFGEAPPPGFSRMQLALNLGPQARQVQYEADVRLEDTRDCLSRVHAQFLFPKSSSHVEDTHVRAAGLFDLATRSIKHQPGLGTPQELEFRDLVTQLSEVQGRLFPLQPGNHLEFVVRRVAQAPASRLRRTTSEQVYHHRFHVMERVSAGATGLPALPGDLFLIDHEESAGGLTRRERLLYSETLGAVVRRRDVGPESIGELILRSWEGKGT